VDARLVGEDVEGGGGERAVQERVREAASSTQAPRAVFTSTEPGFIVARRAALTTPASPG